MPTPHYSIGFMNNDYTVGWICALETELAASQAMLDEEHPDLLSSAGRERYKYLYYRTNRTA